VGGFDFTLYDDPDYVTGNPMVRAGLTVKGLAWAFTHAYASNWHPLTWISHMLDVEIFGLHAGGPHLVNVALHAANAVLLFILLQRMTGAQWRSATVAALFAFHPLHVESVAWVSERKDVLSTFFGLLSLLAYVRYVNESKARGQKSKVWFGLSLGLFALGLLAKPMLVTLPFVLLLLDFWPLRRFDAFALRAGVADASVTSQRSGDADIAKAGTRSSKFLILEKVPFFLLSIASCVITFYAQKVGGSVVSLGHNPFRWRVFTAIDSYGWYARKIFWPDRLAILYPLDRQHLLMPFVCAFLFLSVATIAAIKMAKRRPFFLVGWLWFLGTLVPVIGLVQVGMQDTADRYSYFPSIGLFIVIIWWGYELVSSSKLKLALGNCALAIALVALFAAAFVQVGYWKDNFTLFRHTIAVTQNNQKALVLLGVGLSDEGHYDDAMKAFKAALEIGPWAEIYKHIGTVLAKTGKPEEALLQYERAEQMDPTDEAVEFYLATTLAKLGRQGEALPHNEEAVRLQPENAFYQNELGAALAGAGRKDEALKHYAEAVRLEPGNAQYQNNFATALARSGQESEAIEHYQMATRDDPKFADAYSNLGALHAAQHRLEDAARDYSEAVDLKPTNAVIYLNAGIVFLKLGKIDKAVDALAEAVRMNPQSSDALYEYGHALFLQGQYERARQQLSQAVQMKPDNALAEFYLGLANLQLHSAEEGLKRLAEASRLRPNWVDPLNAQAWVLATSDDDKVRNGAKALELARQAVDLTSRQQPAVLNTLAAAYGEIGQFTNAVAAANEAMTMAQQRNQADLVVKIQQALTSYQSGHPYREKNPGQ
jgi:tetratricopeptide (TPR) repeat protein